jgi:pyruvate/2-oxoglutarate dehydrogenase complex dihydrolipoamide dehydrogenase (E3) component
VGLADYVKPSPKGTKWGLGGTCVNVGCIPKKLMHFASMCGHSYADQQEAGWELPPTPEHSWSRMQANVARHIKALNWGYKVQLLERFVEYHNKLASFVDAHTILVLCVNTE